MSDEDIAAGLSREKSVPERIVDWFRRHIRIHTGKHGEKSADISIRIEF